MRLSNHRKYKLPNQQNGHAYLTSHRACYVDNLEPRKHSVAVDLKSIEKYEFYVKQANPSDIGERCSPSAAWLSQVVC